MGAKHFQIAFECLSRFLLNVSHLQRLFSSALPCLSRSLCLTLVLPLAYTHILCFFPSRFQHFSHAIFLGGCSLQRKLLFY